MAMPDCNDLLAAVEAVIESNAEVVSRKPHPENGHTWHYCRECYEHADIGDPIQHADGCTLGRLVEVKRRGR